MTKKSPKNENAKIKILIWAIAIITFLPLGQNTIAQQPTESLYSTLVAEKFLDIAYELANSKKINPQNQKINFQDTDLSKKNTAIVFLKAAMQLDKQLPFALPYTLKLASSYPQTAEQNRTENAQPDNSQFVYQLLLAYIDESADFYILKNAINFSLQQLDTRRQREELLQKAFTELTGKNNRFDSYLATELGLLSAEKTDVNSATAYLTQAYNKYNYNNLAFYKLAEIVPQQIKPATYLLQLRLTITENPLDFDAAMDFTKYAEQLNLFQIAADAYKYCADLHEYLHPEKPLPSYIYLPWMLNYCSTEKNQYKALQIVEKIRKSGTFDLITEAIAAKATQKTAPQQAKQILENAEKKALKIIKENPQTTLVNQKQLAWFYCFAKPQPAEAINWANKAYAAEPNSPIAAALLAYALTENGQNQWAENIIENYPKNQISNLTLAKILLEKQQKQQALKYLQDAIKKDPASLEAQLAKNILQKQGGQYLKPVDAQLTLKDLKNNLQGTLVPEFYPPDKIIQVRLNTRGNKFAYDDKFKANLNITNNSKEPLVISDDSLFKGYIRVDANITGDLTKQIPALVNKRTLPSSPIPPGQNLLIPLKLYTAELKNILTIHPQADLNIEFTAFLDPVTTPEGKTTNYINEIAPAKTTVKRSPLKLNAEFLRNRFNTISKGKMGQKIQIANLFIGLLAEQNSITNKEAQYKFIYADWMPELLKAAIVHNLKDENWTVKANTMAQMLYTPLNYEMTNAVAENLYDDNFPVRLIAIYLLAKNQNENFSQVIEWFALNDKNKLVRDLASELNATIKKPNENKAKN